MPKALVITEKPSVARDLSAAVGGFTEHDGYWENDDLIVSFAVGHLFELLEPEEIDPEYKRWTLDNLPIIPDSFSLKKKKNQKDRIKVLKELLDRDDVDRLVNACDAGREGELIFREIVKYFDSPLPIERLWLQSMTDQAIRNGMQALLPGSELDGLAAAAECRAYSDWLIGMNATRALTKRLKSRKERTAWSAGRVQTPTLALLVDREFEVLAHQPVPFWRLTGTFVHEGTEYEGAWFDPAFRTDAEDDAKKDDRLFEEARAQQILAAVEGRDGTAGESRKPSRESAPPLFDLTSLQREGNRRFGWSARRTLGAAQRCYEAHKILTYPRTDSRCLPSDYRGPVDEALASFASARGGFEGLSDYAAAASRLREAGLQNEGRNFDDSGVSDHFAIIPTGVLPGEGLSGDDKKLYDLVTRRFLSAFHPPALWERVERVTVVSDQQFRTRARSLQEPGWRACLPPGGDEESTRLPALREGENEVEGVAIRTTSIEIEADQTKPPARITEARLLSLMENAGKQIDDEDLAAVLHEKGIGTPATRADVIENLIAKGYAVRVGKALRPTVKGIRLIDTLRRIHIDRLASPELTGEMEQHLLQVEKGARAADDYLEEIKTYAREIVDRAKNFEYEEVYANEGPLGDCPNCGRPVFEQAWFYRCEQVEGVSQEDDCPVRFWKDTSGRYMDRRAVAELLKDGKTGTLDGFTARSGRTYRGHLELDREEWKVKVRSEGWNEDAASDQPEYEVNPAPLGRCPFEEDCQVVESPTFYICERKLKEEELGKDPERPQTCGFALPRTVCKREITREEASHYLAQGRTELLEEFTSRFGRPFSATLVLRKTGRHGFEFPPRKGGAGGRKKGGSKKTGSKKTARKKTGRKATSKKSPRKKTTAKRSGVRKKTAAKKKASTSGAGTRKAASRERSSED